VPWPFDQIEGAVRSALGISQRAEAEVAEANPLRETQELEDKLDETVAAVHRACESIERHADSIGALSDSLPALTESVSRLTDELTRLLRVTAPLAAAEREASRLDRLLHRHPQQPPAPPPAPGEGAEATSAMQPETGATSSPRPETEAGPAQGE
jgi:chromosome segregation ATPase